MALHDPEEDRKRRARARAKAARARRRRPTLPGQASDTARTAVQKRRRRRLISPPFTPPARKPVGGLGDIKKTGPKRNSIVDSLPDGGKRKRRRKTAKKRR